MTRRSLCVVAIVALASAGPVFSQCADPSNLLSADLCGFDTAASVNQTTGWWKVLPEFVGDPDWGNFVHSATGGRTSPGSMVGTSVDNGPPPFGFGSLLGARYCLPHAVAIGDTLGFGGWVRLDTGAVNYCEVSLFTSGSVDCSTGALDVAFDTVFTVPVGTWTKLNSGDVTLTANNAAVAVELRMACGAGSEFTATFDDTYIGQGMVPVDLQSLSIE
jgi:hypothetical protein